MSSPAPLNRPEPLGAHHQVAAFDCGAPALNEFLSRHALGNHQSGTAKSYVATTDSHSVVGYFQTSASTCSKARIAASKAGSSRQVPIRESKSWCSAVVEGCRLRRCSASHAASRTTSVSGRRSMACSISETVLTFSKLPTLLPVSSDSFKHPTPSKDVGRSNCRWGAATAPPPVRSAGGGSPAPRSRGAGHQRVGLLHRAGVGVAGPAELDEPRVVAPILFT